MKNADGIFAKVAFFRDVTEGKKIRKTLKKKEMLLNGIVNNSHSLIFVKDTQGKYLMVNDQFEKCVTLGMQNIIGGTDFDLFPEEQAHNLQANDQEALKSTMMTQFKEVMQLHGNDHVFISNKFQLSDSKGSVYGVAGIATDITQHQQLEYDLQKKNKELEEANIALRVLVQQQKNVVGEVQQNVLAQLEKTVLPYITLLRQSPLDDNAKEYLDIISSHISEVGKSFIKKLSNPDLKLTKKEILVADLVKQGKSTKEIAQLLTLKVPSVETYRNKIRKKLSINNKKVSLYQYLLATFTSES